MVNANENELNDWDAELERYAYPCEIERLARIARQFNDPSANDGATDAFVLTWAITHLSLAISRVLGKSHPLYTKARNADGSDSEALDVWRQAAELPPKVIEEMIAAVRNQRNAWALEDGEELDLR